VLNQIVTNIPFLVFESNCHLLLPV